MFKRAIDASEALSKEARRKLRRRNVMCLRRIGQHGIVVALVAATTVTCNASAQTLSSNAPTQNAAAASDVQTQTPRASKIAAFAAKHGITSPSNPNDTWASGSESANDLSADAPCH